MEGVPHLEPLRCGWPPGRPLGGPKTVHGWTQRRATVFADRLFPLRKTFVRALERFAFEKEKREAAAQRRRAKPGGRTAFFPRNGRPCGLECRAFQTEIALLTGFPCENFCKSLKMGTCRMRKSPKRRSRGSDGPGSAQEESMLSKRAVPLAAAMRQAACAHHI